MAVVNETPGSDTFEGGFEPDQSTAGAGDHWVSGEGADDLIHAGAGNATASVGTSDNVIFGQCGDDVHDGGAGEDAGGRGVDALNLMGLDRAFNTPAPGATEAGRVEFPDTCGNVTSITTYSEIEEVIICFTPGTLIATKRGEVPVHLLNVGDLVLTRDNGVQPLRWVGRRDLNAQELLEKPAYFPVMIRAGALGKGMPQRDTMVSPNHRMLVTSQMAKAMFGEREVLVAAKHLTSLAGVEVMQVPEVSYIHLMFHSHEVILANGCWAESFQPGDHSMAGVQPDQRREILDLFPELEQRQGLNSYTAARKFLRSHEAQLLTIVQRS